MQIPRFCPRTLSLGRAQDTGDGSDNLATLVYTSRAAFQPQRWLFHTLPLTPSNEPGELHWWKDLKGSASSQC